MTTETPLAEQIAREHRIVSLLNGSALPSRLYAAETEDRDDR